MPVMRMSEPAYAFAPLLLACALSTTLLGADKTSVLTVRLTETEGLARSGELITVDIPSPNQSLHVTDASGNPVASQVVRTSDQYAICFAVDVRATQARIYHIKPGIGAAPHEAALTIAGQPSKQQEAYVRNRFYTATLMPRSGALNTIIPAGDPRWVLYNETAYRGSEQQIGPIHWTPDVLTLGRTRPQGTWVKTYEWTSPPGLQESRGPVLYHIRRRGALDHYPEVDAEVIYTFAGDAAHIVVESTIRIVDDLDIRFLRNGEWVFKRGLFTRGLCKDKVGQIHHFDLRDGHGAAARRPVHPEDPYLAVYNPDTGLGFATVRQELRNSGPNGGEPELHNYSMFVFGYGNVLEIARKLVGLPGGDRDPAKQVTVRAGNTYYMREAIFCFDARVPDAFEALDQQAQRLLHPLVIEKIGQ